MMKKLPYIQDYRNCLFLKPNSKKLLMKIFVLLYNPNSDNEGIHSIELKGRTIVLMFEEKEDAERYVGLLEAQDFPAPSVQEVNLEEIKDFCRRCDYETMIRVSTSYKGGERSIVGTLVGGNKPRIIEVQGISVESDFPSDLLYVRNYDRPGFIGAMGSLLGELDINIATFHLGRSTETEEAIALIEVDGEIDKSILTKVRELPQVVRADYLQFSS